MPVAPRPVGIDLSRRLDWPRLVSCAAVALQALFATSPAQSPARVARCAARHLPRRLAAVRLRELRRQGWLAAWSQPADDVLERGGAHLLPTWEREFWRLALFGLPGQGGGAHEEHHRNDVYNRHCAAIRGAMTDFSALSAASQRAMDDPEVRADSVLRGMLRTFVAQRQAELHNQRAGVAAADKPIPAAQPAQPGSARNAFSEPELYRQSAQWVRGQLTNLRLHFENSLAHYDEAGARRDLADMRALCAHNPGMIEGSVIERCSQQFERLQVKLEEFRSQIESLKHEALSAAKSGLSDRALWVARRLSAIHDMLPEVLPTERFQSLHGEVLAAVKSVEAQEALHALASFERSVADELKLLAGKIHRFHALSQREPHDSPVYLQARQEYETCVRAILKRDEDWLAGMMLKLDTLLEDLEQDRDRLEEQVERFIENVRSALVKVRREIIAIRDEHRAQPPGGPKA